MEEMEREIKTSAVSPAMRLRIKRKLAGIEKNYGIRILYACESGSRGWGFASPDSDYDVRFIYVHPIDWYLKVEAERDVIELPINSELDINGWELRKTLKLLKQANPTLMEWLDSPVIYHADPAATNGLKTLVPHFFSDIKARYHYLSMAKKNFRGYLQSEEVRLKKYFYVLRPLLAVRWIEMGKGVPPIDFETLVAETVDDPQLKMEIDDLLRIKRNANEAEYGPRKARVHAFIESELDETRIRCELQGQCERSPELLDNYLKRWVMRS
ncbi:nucleotidyltransferase domain-containing protein [Xenorhabdus sp. Reich]|uniref:Nucleotidyltransferase domain-containing protein n=1 Tax=Xenorhabdus littoralis TaxID=2582835 RepID=A0ABU4SIZ9_9GAMM|nr:nucleotidyltransferase domain-containing protein [Xenorhabdus sp. Reich]MDX7998570.1 nucleotidyltransferase domain-containing protein [Xenorhabdus sp. Reich]